MQGVRDVPVDLARKYALCFAVHEDCASFNTGLGDIAGCFVLFAHPEVHMVHSACVANVADGEFSPILDSGMIPYFGPGMRLFTQSVKYYAQHCCRRSYYV